jgi:hypothetical protein
MERLARALIEENKLDKAEEILDISLEKMPPLKFGHYSMLFSYLDLYYEIDRQEKARNLASALKEVLKEKLYYYSQFDESNIEGILDEIERNLRMYDQIVRTAVRYDTKDYATTLKDEYLIYIKLFSFLIEDEESSE